MPRGLTETEAQGKFHRRILSWRQQALDDARQTRDPYLQYLAQRWLWSFLPRDAAIYRIPKVEE